MKRTMHRFQAWLIVTIAAGLLGTLCAQEESDLKAETSVDSQLTLAPMGRYVSVKGNANLFSEHHWMPEGADGGASFAYTADNADLGKLTIEGHGIVNAHDYGLDVTFQPVDSIFTFKVGASNFRKYYDDAGGYYRDRAYSLNDDELHMDMSTVYVELGIKAEDFPEIVFGYEGKKKEGTKSTLEWASTAATGNKKILPATKEIDEYIHTFSLDVRHTIGNVNIEDNLRYIVFDGRIYRWDSTGTGPGTTTHVIPEEWNEEVWNNTLLLDSWLTDSFLLSFGYMYETMNGESWMHLQQFPYLGTSRAKDFESNVDDIKTESHVLSLSGLYLATDDLTILMGLQGEASQTDTAGSFIIDELSAGGAPQAGFPEHIDAETSTDMTGLREEIEIRYSGISATQLYAKATFFQENWDKEEQEREGATLPLDRQSDADISRQKYRLGISTSPMSSVNLNAYYQKSLQSNDYDHNRDFGNGAKDAGYSAFISRQEWDSDEFAAKLTIQNTRWLQTSYKYQVVSTEIFTENIRESANVPGGRANSYDYLSQIHTISFTIVPNPDWLISLGSSYRTTQSKSPAINARYIDVYTGDVYSVFGNVTYSITKDTRLNFRCSMEVAENDQDTTASFGFPTVASYERQSVGIGLTHAFTDSVSANIGCDYYNYDDDNSGDYGAYEALVVSAGVSLSF